MEDIVGGDSVDLCGGAPPTRVLGEKGSLQHPTRLPQTGHLLKKSLTNNINIPTKAPATTSATTTAKIHQNVFDFFPSPSSEEDKSEVGAYGTI